MMPCLANVMTACEVFLECGGGYLHAGSAWWPPQWHHSATYRIMLRKLFAVSSDTGRSASAALDRSAFTYLGTPST